MRQVTVKRLGVSSTVFLALLLTGCGLKPPVQVELRESRVGQGWVAEVTNTSEEFLHELRIRIQAPGGEAREYFEASLEPYETLSVGWLKLEGWPIPEGSRVTVKAKGYLLASGPWP